MLSVLLDALLPLFAVMGLGYFAGRQGKMDNQNVGQLNTLVMEFAIPASLFITTADTPREVLFSKWPLLSALILSMLMLYALNYGLQRRYFQRPSGEAALQSLTSALPNYAAAGLPLITAVYGSGHTVAVALAIAAGAIFPSPITLMIVQASQGGAPAGTRLAQIGRQFLQALRRPIVLGPLLGVVFSVAAVPLPSVVTYSFELIGRAGGGVALFLTGVIISAQKIDLNRNVALGAILKNILHPLLVLAMVKLLPLDSDSAETAVLLAALPSGFFGILFGLRFGIRSQVVGSTLVLSTLTSMLTLGVLLAIYTHH